jgi:hypothetical protein
LATPILKPHPIRTKCSGFVGIDSLKSLIEYYECFRKITYLNYIPIYYCLLTAVALENKYIL